jgi:hypothetical protein
MKKNNCYIVIILLCLGLNILGNFTCLCNKSLDDEATSTTSEETKSTTSNSSGDGGTPTSAEDDAKRFREELKELDKKFAKEQAEEALKTEEKRQEEFKESKERDQEIRKDFLNRRIPIRTALKQIFETNPSQATDFFVPKDGSNVVKFSKFQIHILRQELGDNTTIGLTNDQKKCLIKNILHTIDHWLPKLKTEQERIERWIDQLYPEAVRAGTYTPENLKSMGIHLQGVKSQLEDLRQQRSELTHLVSEQGENIEDYVTPPDLEETPEESNASKSLLLAISDPSDAIELVKNLEQKMQAMIDQYAPVPTTRVTLKISESVKKQAKELANQAYALQRILESRESDIEDIYFGTDMHEHIDRSTEEGVEKLNLIEAAIDQLEAIEGLFSARFHVVGYSSDLATIPNLTQSYINALVNALVDQLVPGSELVKGKTLPTTAETWADLALSSGLEMLQKIDTTNRFGDATGIWHLIKPIGSPRYNMLKERITEVYRQRAK